MTDTLIRRNFFGILFVLVTSAIICSHIDSPSAFGAALPGPSPSGGNYLVLDGVDDYAILDFDKFGALFGEGTDQLTVEAWVYPISAPKEDEYAIILSQQFTVDVVGEGHPWYESAKESIVLNDDDLVLSICAYILGHACSGTNFSALTLSQWHHIAFQVRVQPIRQMAWICDDSSVVADQALGGLGELENDVPSLVDADIIPKADFVIGGYGERWGRSHLFWGFFAGYIDEVRISTAPRYDVEDKDITPEEAFDPDENTVALWHFDEPIGANTFLDSSVNGRHLTGMNGASTAGPIAVDVRGKLTTTWAAIRTYGYP